MSITQDSPENEHIRKGLAELEAGQGVSNERVMEWLDSWGSENELPAPVGLTTKPEVPLCL
jgi:predicted transcriptional regulator